MTRNRARYALTPRSEPELAPAPGIARMRRLGLMRISPSPHSALGTRRHERMERIAEQDR